MPVAGIEGACRLARRPTAYRPLLLSQSLRVQSICARRYVSGTHPVATHVCLRATMFARSCSEISTSERGKCGPHSVEARGWFCSSKKQIFSSRFHAGSIRTVVETPAASWASCRDAARPRLISTHLGGVLITTRTVRWWLTVHRTSGDARASNCMRAWRAELRASQKTRPSGTYWPTTAVQRCHFSTSS